MVAVTEADHPQTEAECGPARVGSVLEASGIEKSYRRGMWPVRRRREVLRGAELNCGFTPRVGWYRCIGVPLTWEFGETADTQAG